MSDWIAGQWVWITGAAGGLGAAMARELHRRGARLFLTDLDLEALRVAADGLPAVCAQQDVVDPERWTELADQLADEGRFPRLLVNNAGVGALGRAVDLPLQSWSHVIDVSLWGVIHGCRTVVPRMVERSGRSAVLNVASAAAHFGGPLGAPYFIAKSGVLSLTQTLQAELDPRHVSLTALCPGSVGTGIGAASLRLGDRALDTEPIGAMLAPSGRSAEVVARRGIAAALAGRPLINVYREAWLMDLGSRVLPRRLQAWLSRRFYLSMVATAAAG